MKNVSAALLVLFGFLLSGCLSQSIDSSNGTPIDPQKVSAIQKGKTTRADVEVWFGTPTTVGIMGDGRRTMLYNSVDITGASKFHPSFIGVGDWKQTGVRRMQRLQIILNTDGVVEDYEYADTSKQFGG